MATLHITFKMGGNNQTHQISPTHYPILTKKDIDEANNNHPSHSYPLSSEIWGLIEGEIKRMHISNLSVDRQSVSVIIDTDDGYKVSLNKKVINACYDNPLSL